MYLIRETFHAKPGKAKDLVKRFKQAIPHFEKSEGGSNYRVMTDVVAHYWTVQMEYEVSDISTFMANLRGATMGPEIQEIMKGYIDSVEGGKREIYLIE